MSELASESISTAPGANAADERQRGDGMSLRTKLILRGRSVVPGIAQGEAMVSPEPISGWGGIDPAKGTIIERRHALYGACFTGKILIFPSAKGSSGWAGFFQATRLQGTAPLGLVIARISAKSALGAVVTRVPTLTDLDDNPCAVIATGDYVRIDADSGYLEVYKT
jgi:predicted aconitase with swiveling domain